MNIKKLKQIDLIEDKYFNEMNSSSTNNLNTKNSKGFRISSGDIRNNSSKNKEKFQVCNKNTKKNTISKEKRLLSANRKSQNFVTNDNKFGNKINKVVSNNNNSPSNLYSVTYVDFEKFKIKEEKNQKKINFNNIYNNYNTNRTKNENENEDSDEFAGNKNNPVFRSKGVISRTKSTMIMTNNTSTNFNKTLNNKSTINLSVNKLDLKLSKNEKIKEIKKRDQINSNNNNNQFINNSNVNNNNNNKSNLFLKTTKDFSMNFTTRENNKNLEDCLMVHNTQKG